MIDYQSVVSIRVKLIDGTCMKVFKPFAGSLPGNEPAEFKGCHHRLFPVSGTQEEMPERMALAQINICLA